MIEHPHTSSNTLTRHRTPSHNYNSKRVRISRKSSFIFVERIGIIGSSLRRFKLALQTGASNGRGDSWHYKFSLISLKLMVSSHKPPPQFAILNSLHGEWVEVRSSVRLSLILWEEMVGLLASAHISLYSSLFSVYLFKIGINRFDRHIRRKWQWCTLVYFIADWIKYLIKELSVSIFIYLEYF